MDRATVKISRDDRTAEERAWDDLARRRASQGTPQRTTLGQAVQAVAVRRRLITPAIAAALIPAMPKVLPREPYLVGRAPGKRCAITVVEMLALRALAVRS